MIRNVTSCMEWCQYYRVVIVVWPMIAPNRSDLAVSQWFPRENQSPEALYV